MEQVVYDLIRDHEAKRKIWWPSDLMGSAELDDPETYLKEMRERADGIPDAVRISIAICLLTEEGLPHFHRLIAVHFGDDSFWRKWNNLWTAEEDRHGVVLHDYCRETRILHARSLDQLQFDYINAGFHPRWEYDPYRLFVYTSLQERATQFSHTGTGKIAEKYDPKIGYILYRVAGDEARHFGFYRQVFAEILKRDPNRALESASHVVPSLEMPGASMPNFKEYSDVIRRAGIYGPRDYQRLVEEQIAFWDIENLTGLNEMGEKAQERILQTPKRLKKIADYYEARTTEKSFSFDIVYQREFEMD